LELISPESEYIQKTFLYKTHLWLFFTSTWHDG